MECIYRVTVGADVRIARMDADAADYRAAKAGLIQRETTAIECFYDNVARDDLDGVFHFSSADIARSFALLTLKARQERLAANMDRILGYGDTPP